MKKPRRTENPLEENDVARRVEDLTSSSTKGAVDFTSLIFSIDDRDKKMKLRHIDEREQSSMQGNQALMRRSGIFASSYYQKENNKQKLHKLRETLCDSHSDQIERLNERTRMQSLLNSSKTEGPMEDLDTYSQHLEEKTNLNLEGTHRNEHLKQEFRSFYDTYQLEESEFSNEMEGQIFRIEKLSQRKQGIENMVSKEQISLSPLKSKFSSARTVENVLKAKLQDMAAKFEMFTGLLHDSNEKFTSVKIEMNSKTEVSKTLSCEISEFKKKVIQTNVLLNPAETENVQRGEAIHKIQRQIEQLKSLYQRLRAQHI